MTANAASERMEYEMKMTVMIQYVGHVVHCGGSVTYRSVVIDLTAEQSEKLRMHDDEFFGPISISHEQHSNETGR